MNQMYDENLQEALVGYKYLLESIEEDVEANFKVLEKKISLMQDNMPRKKLKLAQGALNSYQIDFQKVFKAYIDTIMLLETYTNEFRLKLLEVEKNVTNIDIFKSQMAEFKKLSRIFLDCVNDARDTVIKMMPSINFSEMIYINLYSTNEQQLIETLSKFNNSLTIKLRDLKKQLSECQYKVEQLRQLKNPVDQFYKKINLK